MKYPFLTNNELILFDYLPGGSGQLLMRIWSELDIKLDYTNRLPESKFIFVVKTTDTTTSMKMFFFFTFFYIRLSNLFRAE